MIVLINLKTKAEFIEICFSEKSKLTKKILTFLKFSNPKNKIAIIFCNLFLDEYKVQVFLNNKKEDLFILNSKKFTKVNIEGLDILPKSFYTKILKIIFDLDFTYEENHLELTKAFDDINLQLSKFSFNYLAKQNFIQ